MSNEFNPYAAPVSPTGPPVQASDSNALVGLWREGNQLAMHIKATLPDLCVKTGTPTNNRITRKFQWHNPMLALAILGGLLLYVILALVFTKRAKISLPLSDETMAVRKSRIGICWIVGLLFLACVIGGGYLAATAGPDTGALGVLMVVVGLGGALVTLVVGSSIANVIKPAKINDTHAWFKGVHPSILDQLPEIK